VEDYDRTDNAQTKWIVIHNLSNSWVNDIADITSISSFRGVSITPCKITPSEPYSRVIREARTFCPAAHHADVHTREPHIELRTRNLWEQSLEALPNYAQSLSFQRSPHQRTWRSLAVVVLGGANDPHMPAAGILHSLSVYPYTIITSTCPRSSTSDKFRIRRCDPYQGLSSQR
jgi:hypothetical protein